MAYVEKTGSWSRIAGQLRKPLLLVVLLLFCANAFAQTTGRVVGKTTANGSSLSGVTVAVTAPSLPAPRIATTDNGGLYTIDSLPAGSYTVQFELDGFNTVTRSIEVRPPDSTRADVELERLWYRRTEIIVPLIVVAAIALVAGLWWAAKRYQWWEKVKRWWAKLKEAWLDMLAEMKKVTWPTKNEVVGTTAVVIVATIVFALFLWGCDVAFYKAIDFLFTKFGAATA